MMFSSLFSLCSLHARPLHASHDDQEYFQDVPGVLVVKNLPANAGDMGAIPGQGARILHTVG